MLSYVLLFRVRPKSYRVKAKSIPDVNWGYAGDEFDTTDLFGFSLLWWKMQRLEEHTFVNVQQQQSLQAQLHESRNLSPKAYSRNLFLPPPINCNKCFA